MIMKRLCIGLVCCLQFLMLSGQSLPVGSGTIRWIDPQTARVPRGTGAGLVAGNDRELLQAARKTCARK